MKKVTFTLSVPDGQSITKFFGISLGFYSGTIAISLPAWLVMKALTNFGFEFLDWAWLVVGTAISSHADFYLLDGEDVWRTPPSFGKN
jgi:hypothetical protein